MTQTLGWHVALVLEEDFHSSIHVSRDGTKIEGFPYRLG